MMKYLPGLFFLLSLHYSFSQVIPQKFAQTITPSDLKKHLFRLASDEMEGRETATEGQKRAADYIENQFREHRLVPAWNGGYQQKFTVYRDSLVKASLNIHGREMAYDSDFVATNNSGFNISLIEKDIVFAGYGVSDSTRNDYKNINANGKVVMVWMGQPNGKEKGKTNKLRPANVFDLQEAAKKNGAAALLIVQERFVKMPSPRKGRMYYHDFRKDSIPDTFIISDSAGSLILGKDAAQVKKQMKTAMLPARILKTRVKLELEKVTDTLQSSNVIGMIEGTDKKDEAVVITAHYDHLGKKDSTIFYGADDDGSGTVSILEISEAFATAADSGISPRRSVIFMTVSGEEKGLWGSEYYSDNPVFPLEKTSANVNIDMIGRIEKGRKDDSLNYIYVVGDNRLSSDLRPISESVNNRELKFKFDYKFNDPNDPERIFYRSDHYNFAKKGVPAIFYFSGLHDDYHQPTDTPDKIRYDLLARRDQMIFYMAWEIANRADMLKRDLP
jgi:hypothetical protein